MKLSPTSAWRSFILVGQRRRSITDHGEHHRNRSATSGSGSPLAMSILSRLSPRDVGARMLVEKWLAALSH